MTLQGVLELKAALRNLPVDLRDDAQAVVVAHGQAAANAIRDAYPTGPARFFKKLNYRYPGGNLKKGVKVDGVDNSQFGTRVIVRSTAKHAYLFEHGSALRRTATGALRGSMPAGKVLVPIVIRERRAMLDDLVALVERAGLTVRRG